MGGVPGAARYRAFISYSHRDAAFGRRLHRRLEGYAVPRRLVGRDTPRGPAPARIAPVFRDLDELPAADDLSVEVRAALADSATLIVVCSPAAAASPWVAREIETFRALHPDRPVLAALVAGEPGEAFPEPLRRPGADGRPIEPLAADFRAGRDGERHALLKLVAGVTGIGLDELVQRDAQRRLRSVTAVTAVAVAAMLAMAALTILALQARAETDRQRAEAEELVEFMLTDLRGKLKGAERLEVLATINQQALDYYADQDVERLPVESRERWARILQAMGEDDAKRGNLDLALGRFRQARDATAAISALDPDNPERLFAHAQSEYWAAFVEHERGRFAEAKPGFVAYRRLAIKMNELAPGTPKYQRELGFAEGNLCTLALNKATRDTAEALRACEASLASMEKAAGGYGNTAQVRADLADRHGWLADAYVLAKDLDRARSQRMIQEAMLKELLVEAPHNMELRDMWIALQRAFASLERKSGDYDAATRRLNAAMDQLDEMIRFDPANQDRIKQRERIYVDLDRVRTTKATKGVRK